ncbi:cytochrome c oxidase subunit II [Ramlibacter rhizophilus]|uniref:Cytochrome aa3 subunit 2 n=1 Tax=Ramlibacter rhizophilus TaxID=1781167 RepID=A0A4Z0BTP6_9BURK|nr:cytochrome c oxidase subunit II [Ramlibacter rhizophilus]TFZ01385.1 cytochrome c oxidase subunit II [Ramlibacter rhizophilus]
MTAIPSVPSPAAPPVRAAAQSAFEAWSEGAAQVLEITWVLFVGGAIIFVFVMLLVLLAVAGPGRLRASLAKHGWVVGGGIVFPLVVLTALLVYTLSAVSPLVRQPDAASVLRIEVTGELWWWRVKYLDPQGGVLVETANEIVIPAGVPVELALVSDNVIHSFWVPNLAGKLDMIPGHVNWLRIEAREPGVFRGQCAEYCGAQHAKMAFHVVAQPAADFQRWLQAQQQPASTPPEPRLQLGQRLFLENRCGVCHTVRGTPADGRIGPDLTHVGRRGWIAAATLPNNVGTLAGWIANPQHIKDGARMPAYHQFSPEELRALAEWLMSLR